ncbi:hypothetical protein L596_018323 [Steinernema carpocapsae]|uniref:Major facilitator superfamily (MFS) profile domain-containing protein n=1 Tax=Steinernema carpocapsae TaxID=34508 RepID=A0A4U5N4L4_STECR|nr:hypothetical protein L596_018323 [Steinernema carpocapsae]
MVLDVSMNGDTRKPSSSLSVDGIFRTPTSASVSTKASISSDPDLHSIYENPDRLFLKKKRWQIAICASIGFMIAFGIRCNFGAAKARMVNNFTDPFGDEYAQEFFWSPTELGMLESSFFYGYAVSQIPGGLLAAKFPPNRPSEHLHGDRPQLPPASGRPRRRSPDRPRPLSGRRVPSDARRLAALGASDGTLEAGDDDYQRKLPRCYGRNAPQRLSRLLRQLARTVLRLRAESGGSFLQRFLCYWDNFDADGLCVMGILWAIWWLRISAPTPDTHKHISNEERRYIIKQVGPVSSGEMTLTTVPWRKILTSLPVWAIVFASFCRSWSFFMLLGNQLTYMQDVLKLQTHHSGLVSAIPQFLLAVTIIASGQIADYLRSNGKMSTKMVRKMFNSIGFLGEAVFLCGLAFITEPYIAVTLLVLASGTSGCEMAGFNVNHFDIAPRYAPILMGFSNGFGALAGIGGFLTEHLTKDNPEGWQACFLVAMGVDLFGFAFFAIFSDGEIQEWAKEKEPEQTIDEIVHRFSTVVRRMSSSLHRPSLRKKTSRCGENAVADCRSVVSAPDDEFDERFEDLERQTRMGPE